MNYPDIYSESQYTNQLAVHRRQKDMQRNVITTDDLKKMAHEHISYEIQMFEATIRVLSKRDHTPLEKNAMLESFLLHSRCLYDFLYPSLPFRSDDVLAKDFFEDPTLLSKVLPPALPIAEYLKSRTGKEIAHITYGRLKVSQIQKVWNVGEVHDQIGGALVCFFEALTEERRGWFSTIFSR